MRSLNVAMIARTLCFLLLFEAAFMLAPLIVALCYQEQGSITAFGIAFGATLLVALGGQRFIRPAHTDLSKYDSVLLTALVWIVFSLFGLIPYMLAPSSHLTFSAAFFEAMSGFTTTGVTLVDSTDSLSHAVHIWHCITEWIGGLGIIIFTLALVPMLNSSGGMQMFNAEQNKLSSDKVSPRISNTARSLWGVYILLTALLFGLLCFSPMSTFEAACHALSTMSTGGLSTSSSGINAFATVYVKVVITLFMFLGGVNFAMVYRLATGHPGALLHSETVSSFTKLILTATAIFICCIIAEGAYTGWQSVTIDPLFQVVSLATSTGFVLENFSTWGPIVVAVSLILIFIGGCAGSTSGGAKVDRVVYLFKFLRNEIKRTLRPNAVLPVRVSRKVIPSTQVAKVVAFICLYVIVAIVGAILLSCTGADLDASFISALAAMGNDGLSTSDSIIGCDYHSLGAFGHCILSFLMLIGRLEIYTILVLLTSSFWRR